MTDLVHARYLHHVMSLNLANYRSGISPIELVMERCGTITLEYAPFDYIECAAKLVIVGLTPGRQQAANALESFASSLKAGETSERALMQAKKTASFSGPMRSNLVSMLDFIGVPSLFGRSKATEFFLGDSELVHFTSTIRYPVFIGGRNYSGTPDPMKHPMLRRCIDTCLAEEASQLPDALWIPLGQHAEAALLHLASAGKLDRRRVLAGLPHPSGANAERIAYFLGNKPVTRLSAKTNPAPLDIAKEPLNKLVFTICVGSEW